MKETHLKGYFLTFAILLGLAFVNVFVSTANVGGFNTAIILTVASVQALVLMAFFMHLRESPKFIWVVVASGFVFVGVLALYVVADNHGRATMVRPPQAWELPEKVTMPALPNSDAAHHATAAEAHK
jgi:cytochrome c oxidase subunit IV